MTTIPQTHADLEIERALACIEKGQQLAGHFPSKSDMEAARRILTGEVTVEEAEVELEAALAQIVAEERASIRGR